MEQRAIGNLARQFRYATMRIETYRRGIVAEGDKRRAIVLSLRAEGWSFGRIATKLGISRGRVEAIASKRS
jgi:DNA-directed RNA polymerase specialized sigma24 family protein